MWLVGVLVASFICTVQAAGNRIFFVSGEGLVTTPLSDGSSPEVISTIPGGCVDARGIAVDHNWKIAIVTCGVAVYKISYENTPATVEEITLQGGEGTAKHGVAMTNRGVSYIAQFSAKDSEWQILAHDFLGCSRHARADTCLDGCKFENNRCKDDNVYKYNVPGTSDPGAVTWDGTGILFFSHKSDIVFPSDKDDPTSNKIPIPVVGEKMMSLSHSHWEQRPSGGNIVFSNSANEIWRTSTGLTRVLKVGIIEPSADSGPANFWYFYDDDVLVAAQGRNIIQYDCSSSPCSDVSEVFLTRTSPIKLVTAWYSREIEVIPEEEFLPTDKPEPVETSVPTTEVPSTPAPPATTTAPSSSTTTPDTTQPDSSDDGTDIGIIIVIAVIVSVVILCLAAGCFFAFRSRNKEARAKKIEEQIQKELQRHPAIVDESAVKREELHSNPLLSLPECGDVHHDTASNSDDALSIITAINTVNTANVTSLNSRTPRTPHTPRSFIYPSTPTMPTAPPRRRGPTVRGNTPEPHFNYQTRRARAATRTLPPSGYNRQTL